MGDFNKKVVRIGTITVSAAIIANFIPVLYLWLAKGQIPPAGDLLTIWGLVIAGYAVSWIVQPLSYYGGLGMVGSYISWIAGSAADVRMPSITMAQKVSDTEANTPEGDAIGSMALAASVFLTIGMVTLFTLVGSSIIPRLPKVITDAFAYMLPALFAAVFVNMASKNLKSGLPTLVIGVACCFLLPKLKVPSAVITLVVVLMGMVVAGGVFKLDHKPKTGAGQDQTPQQ